MKQSKIGIENVKLWTIIPWIIGWGIIGVILEIIFDFSQHGIDFLSVYLYLIVLIWIARSLHKREISFLELSTKETIKKSWVKVLAFVPVVKLASSSMMIFLGLLLLYFFPTIGQLANNADFINNQLLPIEIIISFIIVIVLAPIVEEIFFRGMMLNKWGKKYGLFNGILLTSLIFALIHPTTFFAAFLSSFLFSILYVKTKKLYVPIIAHAFGNLIVFIPRIFIEPEFENENIEISPSLVELGISFGFTALLLPISIYVLYRLYPKHKDLPFRS